MLLEAVREGKRSFMVFVIDQRSRFSAGAGAGKT